MSLSLLVLALCLGSPSLRAATNLPAFPSRLAGRTNLPPAFPPGLAPNKAANPNQPPNPNLPSTIRSTVMTNFPKPLPGAAGKTNLAGLGPKAGTTNSATGASSWVQTLRNLSSNRAFYPAVGGLLLCLALVFLVRVFKPKAKPEEKSLGSALPSKLSGKTGRKGGAIQSCNVLAVGPRSRQVWSFDARGGRYVLNREQSCPEGEALPGRLVGKDWRALFQRKLNIAWLPPEQVFLRVAQFPRSDFNETLAMVELQLERLSPIPVTQIVWSFHVLPHTDANLQTVIVMIVARSVIEEFLGQLESQGFLADRIELPLLDQLQSIDVKADGAWLYPEAAGVNKTALVAWWYGGVLRNLDLLTLPPPGAEQAALLKEQLMQMAWAGEMEGWLTATPDWHLVAEPAAVAEWETALRAGLEQSIDIAAPLPARELASLTARRSAHAEPRANLLPEEFAARYQQQLVDRLWMRGLTAVGAIYLAVVAIYMVGLSYATWRLNGVEGQVAALSSDYTNAIQLRDRYKVLKERQDLKYAGLESWNHTASQLPDDVTLDSMNFSDGRRFNLNGTAPSGQYKKMLDFEKAMRGTKTLDGDLFFDPTKGEGIQWRDQGQVANWSLNLELKRSEAQ